FLERMSAAIQGCDILLQVVWNILIAAGEPDTLIAIKDCEVQSAAIVLKYLVTQLFCYYGNLLSLLYVRCDGDSYGVLTVLIAATLVIRYYIVAPGLNGLNSLSHCLSPILRQLHLEAIQPVCVIHVSFDNDNFYFLHCSFFLFVDPKVSVVA